MTTKKSWILTSIFTTILLVCCIALAACGSSATTYALTWSVAEHATVTVEGYSELPESIEENTEIVFTITCDTGYEVDSVKAGNTNLTASDGKYTRTISADTTITVTVKKTISSVAVTTNPTKLSYYSGESLDTTGMVVTVNYATGESEVVTGYTVSPSAFTVGDTSFTVTYSKVTSAAVSLDKAVTALITIDPAGGTIDSTYLDTLSSRSDIDNYSVDSEGVISFEHSGLSSAITLPTSSEVTRSGQFSFNSWIYGSNTAITEISASDANSYDLTLVWDAVLITANSIKLEYTTYNGVEAPYLIINFTFEEVESAYLYLYEGNVDVEFVGDTVTIGSSNTVDLYFNLSNLGDYENGSLNGKWMDLRFNATIDGREYSQTFQLDHDNPIAEVGGSVQDATNSYTILTYRNNGVDDIKIAFKPYTTTVGFSVDSASSTLTISGTANLTNLADGVSLSGAIAYIDMNGATFTGSVTDAATGKWSIDVDLTQIATTGLSATNFSNFKIVSADNTTVLLSASAINYTWLTDTYDYSEVFGNPSWYVNSYSYGNGMRLYIGTMDSSSWTDAFFAIVDEVHYVSYDTVTLVADSTDGRPMLVVAGTYGTGYTADEAKTIIENSFYLSLQANSTWTYHYYSSADTMTIVVNDDNTFTVTLDITDISNNGAAMFAGNVIYGHVITTEGGSESNMAIAYIEASVDYNGLTYTIGAANSSLDSWLGSLTIIYVTETTDKSLTFSNVTLAADSNGAPTLVITGTYEGYESADALASDFYLDVQAYSSWSYRYYSTTANSCTATLGSDGTFTITLAITVTGDSGSAMAAGDVLYCHVGTASNNSNMAIAYTAASITYNGLTYTIGACTDELAAEASWLSALTIIYVTTAA